MKSPAEYRDFGENCEHLGYIYMATAFYEIADALDGEGSVEPAEAELADYKQAADVEAHEADRLRAELAEYKRDAERYRYLRTDRESLQDTNPFIAIAHSGGAGYSAWTESHADVVIDIALAAQPKG